ncbi:MAG TPA: RusA family crossover junction endodeoxyribonuclease [Actinomycetes bacterium]|nr:RusA family crossover junction endodeoxyribonuclease [Actinomycetes bacterium]
MTLQITVLGIPVPKGSAKYYPTKRGKVVVTHDNPKTQPWGEMVVASALTEKMRRQHRQLEGPVGLALRFFLPRPKSAPRRVTEPTKKPDLDKLIRAVKDGLTRAGIYRDDAQVVVLFARKEFAAGATDPLGADGIPRAWIEVGPQPEVLASGHWPGEGLSGKAAPA